MFKFIKKGIGKVVNKVVTAKQWEKELFKVLTMGIESYGEKIVIDAVGKFMKETGVKEVVGKLDVAKQFDKKIIELTKQLTPEGVKDLQKSIKGLTNPEKIVETLSNGFLKETKSYEQLITEYHARIKIATQFEQAASEALTGEVVNLEKVFGMPIIKDANRTLEQLKEAAPTIEDVKLRLEVLENKAKKFDKEGKGILSDIFTTDVIYQKDIDAGYELFKRHASDKFMAEFRVNFGDTDSPVINDSGDVLAKDSQERLDYFDSVIAKSTKFSYDKFVERRASLLDEYYKSM